MAWALVPSIWTRFLIRFSPLKTSAKAWAWACPSVTASCRTVKEKSPSAPSPENSASLRWSFQPRDENKATLRQTVMQNLYDYKKFAILYVDDEEKSLKYFARAFEEIGRASCRERGESREG